MPRAHKEMNRSIEVAEHTADRLGQIEGVAAVALGGSWARGDVHPDSDIDLGIYLIMSKEEMEEILNGTRWRVKHFIDSKDGMYIAIIEKE